MTHTQMKQARTGAMEPLSERENQRAVDLIETAERSAPYCSCGAHMIAVAHGNEIWLECSEQDRSRSARQSLVARITSYSHTRRMIMELPIAS